MNPFIKHYDILTGHYATASRIQDLVRVLYECDGEVALSDLLSNGDQRHIQAALDMMTWYAAHGENCPEFMKIGKRISSQYHRQKEASLEPTGV